MLRRFKSFHQGGSLPDLNTIDFTNDWCAADETPLTFANEVRSLEMAQLSQAITSCIEKFNKTELTDDDVRQVLNNLQKRKKAWIVKEAPLFPGDLRSDDTSLGVQKNIQNRQKAKERLASKITDALKNGTKRDLTVDQCLQDDDVRAVLNQLYARDPRWKQTVRFKKQKKSGLNGTYWVERVIAIRF